MLDMSVTSVLLTELEEALQYQFSVFGNYGDVQGVVVTVTATTEEDGTPNKQKTIQDITSIKIRKIGTLLTVI